MLEKLKMQVRKVLRFLSGEFKHLRKDVHVKKRWYGNIYGGFYVAYEKLGKNSIVYSFGIGEDISFDEEIIKRHHNRVFGFDPTPKSIHWIESRRRSLPSEFSFFEYGIGEITGKKTFYLPKNKQHVSGSSVQQTNVDERDTIIVEMKSLKDIAAQLGHPKIDILKMDIEGGEYDVIESLLNSNIEIDQILVEFHERFFPDGKNKTTRIIEKLRTHGYKIFGVSDSFEEVSFIKVSH